MNWIFIVLTTLGPTSPWISQLEMHSTRESCVERLESSSNYYQNVEKFEHGSYFFNTTTQTQHIKSTKPELNDRTLSCRRLSVFR